MTGIFVNILGNLIQLWMADEFMVWKKGTLVAKRVFKFKIILLVSNLRHFESVYPDLDHAKDNPAYGFREKGFIFIRQNIKDVCPESGKPYF